MERDPAAVLQAAIRGVVDRLPEKLKDEKDRAQEFQAARYFVGTKRGYYFGTGEQGTGYYLDPTLISEEEEEAGEKRAIVNPEELLREAEEQANLSEIQLVDSKTLRRYVTAFDRKYKENLEMRMKYADQPEKFMESEVDLDEEVQRLLAVAASPELYPDFVQTGVVEHLMALLSHENTDIAADVLELFNQLTDADVIEDSEEEALALVENMVEHNGLELLVHRLTSLVETSDEEQKAVYNTLSIFENMIEVKPEVAEWVLDRTKLLKWLLGRIKPREFDSNKQYTSELLAILIQDSPKNQQRLADMNGIDSLLQAIAPYKNRNPASIDEEEYLENLFNCLCACLMSAETRTLFQRAEGTELMLLILKQKKIARTGALKALNFATTKSSQNCERFVDQLGLKTIFAIFMGKVKANKKKADADEADEEERALSVIANLFQGLGRGSRRDRLAAKFVENEFEKCDRVVELFDRYTKRVQIAEAEANSEDDLGEEARMLSALDAGIFSLHQCALIIGHLWFVGDLGVRKRILQLLHQRGHSLTDVRSALSQLLESIGDDGNKVDADKERNRVRRMLQALGFEAPLVDQVKPEGSQIAEAPPSVPPAAVKAKETSLDRPVKEEAARPSGSRQATNAESSSSSDSSSSSSSSSSDESAGSPRRSPPQSSKREQDAQPANGAVSRGEVSHSDKDRDFARGGDRDYDRGRYHRDQNRRDRQERDLDRRGGSRRDNRAEASRHKHREDTQTTKRHRGLKEEERERKRHRG